MKNHWLNYIGITAVLFLFWIAVSGSLNWPQLLVGLAVASFVTYFNRNLLITAADRPPLRFGTVVWFTGYLVQLLVAIIKANFHVAWLVLHPKMPIEPNMVTLKIKIGKEASRVLLANSITLTPGTLTVLADDKEFLVHALTVNSGKALTDWSLIAKLKQLEEDGQ